MAPPKTAEDAAGGGKALDQRLHGHLKLAINMLANAGDLKLNNDQLAQVMGFKTGKNIPRKINEVVRPFGFQYSGGRVVPATSTDPADSAEPTTGTAADTVSSPAAAKPPRTPRTPKTPRKTASKKRKLEENEDDDQDKDKDKDSDEEGVRIKDESG